MSPAILEVRNPSGGVTRRGIGLRRYTLVAELTRSGRFARLACLSSGGVVVIVVPIISVLQARVLKQPSTKEGT